MGKFSGVLTIQEAAEKARVSVKTIRRWRKSTFFPRMISHAGMYLIIEEEFDKYLKIKRRPKPKRTWIKATQQLKAGDLTSISSLTAKLKERKYKEWTDIQRKVNDFDDSHVEAYRSGISDALCILQENPIAYIDYVPHIGQYIDVGGCVGRVTDITDTYITVCGEYHYCDGEVDAWAFHYRQDVLSSREISTTRIYQGKIFWNFENIPYDNYRKD